GVIVETEAYNAINDEAAHTFTRPSARSFIERNQPGAAYVYFNYGMHWMLNVLVKGEENGFVLIRALEPRGGIERMKKRRGLIEILRSKMNRNKQRVLLGMSGGVDSSVAGYLLREQGFDVIGVTMKVWPQDCISRAEDKCCGPQAIADARGVAHALGIPHYVVDEADQFERVVIDYFASEYQAGRTPNPCVMCNEKLKFGNLWSKAKGLGCDYIATGHY